MKHPLDNKTLDWCEELNNTGGLNELALFAGAGGGILGSHLLGWNTICAVERDAYAAQVLAQRQNDGILKPFPIWSDITTFDGKPWNGIVDVISGGFPCQDISSAGKGAGIDGDRSGLWAEMARIIGEVRPRFVFVENSPMLVSRGLTRVISDLAALGYDAHWARLSASNLGAPHQRDRIWIVAHTQSFRFNSEGLSIGAKSQESLPGINSEDVGNSRSERFIPRGNNNCQHDRNFISTTSKNSAALSNTTSIGLQGQRKSWFACDPAENPEGQANRTFYERVGHIWGIESQLGRVANGVAHRVDRLKAIGNGQVPEVARSAFKILRGAA
ncbi:DNA cytosine methyltransferase [Acinetobacter soli]|uniref:DNA cytosine methyltransferase n=1 Tax=Acinetobacter soli TaxID=487316 RepID=UPI001D0BCB3F|nr:DNA cytosine methyltransferase [Acinetobacter soli]MCB8769539.1 DNA cytosine methyltransferase [Acinetobacter soli]